MSRKSQTEESASIEAQAFKEGIYGATMEYMERTMASYNVSQNDPIWIVLRGISHVFAEATSQQKVTSMALMDIINNNNSEHRKTVEEVTKRLESAARNSSVDITKQAIKISTEAQKNAKSLDTVIVDKLVPAVTQLEHTLRESKRNFSHVKTMVYSSTGLLLLTLAFLAIQAFG